MCVTQLPNLAWGGEESCVFQVFGTEIKAMSGHRLSHRSFYLEMTCWGWDEQDGFTVERWAIVKNRSGTYNKCSGMAAELFPWCWSTKAGS